MASKRRNREEEVDVGLSDAGRVFWVLTVTVCMVMESNISGFP